jgi:hypothetical protein
MRGLSSVVHGHLTGRGQVGRRTQETGKENDMNTKLLSLGTLSVAGVVAAGALAFPTAAAWSDDDAVKRDEDTPDVVLVADDDDDDTGARGDATNTGNTNTGTNTGNTNTGTGTSSGDQNDGTNSRSTAVSRDRDRSRGDKTRDQTLDGAGSQKRDWSANQTNDRSRNDTRR